MGSVFEAEQENPRRRVALKLLRGAAGSRRVLQRFQQEAQILGRLQHPGIAQILEAGTTDDGIVARPYIVMELVHGRTLLDYSALRRFSTRQKLALFAQVCDAVQYAHQCGVIHRDLKPANILEVDDIIPTVNAEAANPASATVRDRDNASEHKITPEKNAPRPKILDFGVARMVDSDLALVTQQTSAGELVGTVPYMSPEQASGDPLQLDWRSDIYSLGVVLYELLTGRLPHDVRNVMLYEAVRSVREDEPTPVGSLDRALRGDVETILSKALEKNRRRRYQSAADLATDLRRHLNDQPISARPASAWYRLNKFARRNKAIVAGTGLAFLALAVGAAIAIQQAVRAEAARAGEMRQREAAERETYRACLGAASSALRRHEVAEAERHLKAAPEALCGWEWRHLRSRLDDSQALLRTESFNPLHIAIHPSGNSIAACRSSGRITLWSTAERTTLASYDRVGSVNQRRILNLVFSADGNTLRADATHGSVWLDAQTLQELRVDDHSVLRRSRTGNIAVRAAKTPTTDHFVIESFEDSRELFRVAGGPSSLALLRFSHDDRFLAVHHPQDGGLFLYRCADGALIGQRRDFNAVGDLRFDRSGARIAVALRNGDTFILDTHGGSTLASLRGHNGAIESIDFSPDGGRVGTLSSDGTIRLWNAASGTPISVMHGVRTPVFDLAFMPDGAQLVTATAGGELRWWDATIDADPFQLRTPQSVYGLAFSPDGAWLVASCLGGAHPLRMWKTENWREQWAGLDGFLSAVNFDREGKRLVVGRSGNHAPISVISMDGAVLATLSGHFWRTDWVDFDITGKLIYSLGNDGALQATDLSTGQPVMTHALAKNHDAEGCRAIASPNGAIFAAASQRDLRILDRAWNTLATLAGHDDDIYALAFNPDGTRLVSGSRDRTLCVWDLQRHALEARLTGHTDEIFAVRFSPDGKRIVSGGRDRAIRIWDAERLEEIAQLHGHTSYVYCLVFSPDGRTLASGGGDDCIRIWEMRTFREVTGK